MAERYSNPEAADPVAASTLNIIAGIWLILSPFIFRFWHLPVPTWDSIAVGIAVVALAAVRSAAPFRHIGLSWINFLLGIWLIISPWLLGYSSYPHIVWNDVVLGIIVGVLAMWNALTAVPRAGAVHR